MIRPLAALAYLLSSLAVATVAALAWLALASAALSAGWRWCLAIVLGDLACACLFRRRVP